MINLNNYRENIFHNAGINQCPHYSEDGVILKIFDEIGVSEKPLIIEFGEHRSLGTTTRSFRIKYISKAIYFTGNLDFRSKILNILDILKLSITEKSMKYFKFFLSMPFKFFCTPNNINELLIDKKVNAIDILTVDIDSFDYYVIKEVLINGFSPRLMILEYNFNLPINEALSYPYNSEKSPPENKRAYGASFKAIDNLAKSFGYKLVHVSGFCNLFYIKSEYSHLFSKPDIKMEIPKNNQEVDLFIDKYCQKGFVPSWLSEPRLTEIDLLYFNKV